MLPPILTELTEYFAPLSTLQREENGAVTLLTPGVNVLGLNATYLPEDVPDLRSPLAWHEAQSVPPLLASLKTVVGAREVAALEVGTFKPIEPQATDLVVEQVSRLHLQKWADVLTAAHGTPEWATPLARHLAARLERQRDYLPLLAYSGAGEAVGALLWQGINGRSAAHLWGALSEPAAEALLATAAALGRDLCVSLSTTPMLKTNSALVYSETVKFSLMNRP
ncbi:hypothetical protein [Deinococcus humi]|uniref:N-acetyltransferase domain-containing protein n=1 Tax=Deinococcus humi TaxID=662880 RepID=A0A7W8JWT6_9DEIO|nr:hypothetical protein [Deinococcus humi]